MPFDNVIENLNFKTHKIYLNYLNLYLIDIYFIYLFILYLYIVYNFKTNHNLLILLNLTFEN